MTFHRRVIDLTLNAPSRLGDVYLVSRDRRYFICHRVVLASVSQVLARVLDPHDESDEYPVFFLEGYSGDTLKHFLALVYTGSSFSLATLDDEFHLRNLCQDLRLNFIDSLVRQCLVEDLQSLAKGFDEINPAEATPRFLLSPRPIGRKIDFPNYDPNGYNESDVFTYPFLKTEPDDFDEVTNSGVYYMDQMETDSSHLRNFQQPMNGAPLDFVNQSVGSKLFFKCLNCPREFHVRKRYEKHQKECVPMSQRTNVVQQQNDDDDMKGELPEPETILETGKDLVFPIFQCENCPRKFHKQKAFEKHQTECIPHIGDKVQDDPEDEVEDNSQDERRKACPRPDVKFIFKKVKSRVHCMHEDCKEKSQSFSHMGGFREHWLEKHAEEDVKNFSCKYCFMKFASNSIRNKHEKLVHDLEFSCTECGKQYPKNSMLEAHMRSHTGEKPFSCEDCDATFASKSGLLFHSNTYHTNVKQHKCDQCGKRFRFKMSLRKHKYQHEIEKDMNCEVLPDVDETDEKSQPASKVNYQVREEDGRFFCAHEDCKDKSQSFQWRNGFQEHWLEKHATDEEKTFQCQYCSKKFASNGLRNRHLKFKHEYRFKCNQCNKKFPSRQILASHIRTHTGEKPFICQSCGSDFISKANMLSHQRLYHSNVKNQKCDECGKCFRFKATLRKHRQAHSMKGEANCEVVLDAIEDQEEKVSMLPTPKLNYLFREEDGRIFCNHPDCTSKTNSFRWKNGFQEHWLEKHTTEDEKIYPCQYCTKRFGSNALRNRHIKFAHVLRYKCKLCEKKFATRQLFAGHMRTHTGEKPFVCEECGLSFSQKSYLRQHCEFYHSDIKKHKCQECGEQFKIRANLKKHMMHHQLSSQLSDYQVPREVENETAKSSIKIPKVDMPMREEDGRFYCLSGDCTSKGQSFQWINGLREHFMDKHAEEDQKFFPCRYCGKMFGTNGLKNRHENMYHELRFECTLCDKKYGKKTMLLDHMRTHTGEKPFVCETCGADFFSKQSLNWHIRQRHATEEIKKDFKCDQCGKGFPLLCTLNRHIRTVHTENRPFVCEECGKDYKVLAALKRHLEYHSGVTISCEPCNLTFPCQSNYRRHFRRKHVKKEPQI